MNWGLADYNQIRGCIAILPDVKWTLSFGDLVAAVVPILAFLGGMYLKQYFWNSEKFNDEYKDFLDKLKEIYAKLSFFDMPYKGGPGGLIEKNPRKFETRLKSDWNEVKDSIEQLREETNTQLYPQARKYNYSDQEKREPLKKIKRLENKVEHYYMCHSPGRWKYRLTILPGAIKDWYNKTLDWFGF